MHLTRFRINPGRIHARKLISSPHAMHAAVMLTTPDQHTTEDGRTLWRLDHTGHDLTLYVLSPTIPDLTHLIEQAGWPTRPDTWTTRPYQGLLDRLTTGQEWAFRLTANPTHTTSTPDRGRSRRLPHTTPGHQAGWLSERATSIGIDLGTDDDPTFAVTRSEQVQFRRESGTVTLATATFDGALHVTDPDALRHALTTGIGRAKGYGCGLITLAPIT